MFEAKLTIQIDAPTLAQAINNLAAALSGAKPQTMPQQAPAPMPQQTTPMPQQNPAPMPPQGQTYDNVVLMQGAPVNPTQTAPTPAPVAPTAGPTSVYPSNPPAPGATYPAPALAPAPAPAPNAGVPLAQPPQYTVDQIMAAGATLMDAGRVNDLMALLQSFGVRAVTDLKSEQMGAFATALRGLGAKI